MRSEVNIGIQNIAMSLAYRLLQMGCKIQKYDSYSTNSVYLKIDYGLANSIRISDHTGKKKLNYRFNLMILEDGYKEESGKYVRYYYGMDYIEKLLIDLEQHRNYRIARYGGYERYQNLMLRVKKEHKEEKGFWKQAYEITLDSNGNIIRKA